MRQHDVPVRQPGSGSGTRWNCWHDPLKPSAKTDPKRLTRKNVVFLEPLPLALVPVRGAFGPVTPAAFATGQAAVPYRTSLLSVPPAYRRFALRRSMGAPVCAGRGQLSIKAQAAVRAAAQRIRAKGAPRY